MKTSTKLEKIAKAIENYRTSSDGCFIEIELTKNRLRLISGAENMLYGYMLSYVCELVKKYEMQFFVSTGCTDKPYLVIYHSDF